MEQKITDYITELNEHYTSLGEDLLLMESVIIASQRENEFPQEYIMSTLERVMDYTDQHVGEIMLLAKVLLEEMSHLPAPRESPIARR